MATALFDSAIKFGAGRFRQEKGLIANCGEEIQKFGKKILIISGPRAWCSVEDLLTKSLSDAGCTFHIEIYKGECSFEASKYFADIAKNFGAEEVVGVGGGRIMDLVKAVGDSCGCGVITIPTSIATCAAFVSQSVMYTPEGKKDKTWRYNYEIDACLLDLDVIANCPSRYTAAGILDSMAKKIEILNGRSGIDLNSSAIDTYLAYKLSKVTYDILLEDGVDAIKDANKNEVTDKLTNVAFVNIPATGLISNITRGSNQTALAHVIYDCARTLFSHEAAKSLHGEIVAIGLFCQLYYNGMYEEEANLKAFMSKLNMPLHLQDIGIEPTKNNLQMIENYIVSSRHYNGTTDADRIKLSHAVHEMI